MSVNLPAVCTPFLVLYSGAYIDFVVLPTLMVLGCEICLKALETVGCLSIQKLEAEQTGQGRVVGVQVKLLSIKAFVELMGFQTSSIVWILKN
jgi:hypothetical protein